MVGEPPDHIALYRLLNCNAIKFTQMFWEQSRAIWTGWDKGMFFEEQATVRIHAVLLLLSKLQQLHSHFNSIFDSSGCLVNCCSCYDGHDMNKCCHDGAATQFPQGTGLAATWNLPLAFEVGMVASQESRGLMNAPFHTVAADYRTGLTKMLESRQKCNK